MLNEVLGAAELYEQGGFKLDGASWSGASIDELLAGAARFAETVVAPLNGVGDACEAELGDDGHVTTAPGFKPAYAAFRAAGWASIAASPAYGGQGLPNSLELAFNEMAASACLAWRLASGLTLGTIRALSAHASDSLKDTYLPKLVSGAWTGTMCLTEAQAGSDIGIIQARATPRPDGTYGLRGAKIFVTWGEHDLTENIVHMVLARLPNAPPGPKGISLFLAPKFLPGANGTLGARNAITCTALEKKMGISASPTCELLFDDATAWLVGPPHGGLACMFTTMNFVRLDVGQQGLAQAERAFQGALSYARSRLQLRSVNGPKHVGGPADPILVHADVRRMLMIMKSLSEGGRALTMFAALRHDLKDSVDPEARSRAASMLALLVPIAKGFLTEVGIEVTQLGVQCFGGHGYIRANGMEQLSRDVRVTAIYEGTNGIQANDLLFRKVLGDGGAALRAFLADIEAGAAQAEGHAELAYQAPLLRAHAGEWRELVAELGERSRVNREAGTAGAFDHLMYAGYVTLAHFWARMSLSALAALHRADGEVAFYRAKLQTARFYFERVLPRARGHVAGMRAGAESVMDEDALGG